MVKAKAKSKPKKTKPPQHAHTSGRLHLDRRAEQLAAVVDTENEDLLSTRQVAAWFGVSIQWLEIGRTKNYGPPFHRMGNNVLRYSRTELKAWLAERSYRCTAEYSNANPQDKRFKRAAGAAA